jgi:hypothetical protein
MFRHRENCNQLPHIFHLLKGVSPMHHRLAPFFRAAMLSLCLIFAANVAQAQQAKTIKPKMAVADADFVAKLMNTIDISGNEVDAFLEVRGVFIKVLEVAVKEKKLTSDVVTVEMTVPQAQNFVTLMQRTKLKGEEAGKFRELITMIVDAAKAELGDSSKK